MRTSLISLRRSLQVRHVGSPASSWSFRWSVRRFWPTTCGSSRRRSHRNPGTSSERGSESDRTSSVIRFVAMTQLIDQFVVQAAAGRKPLVGRPGADPAGLLRVDAPGLMVIGYRSHPSAVEQTAEKFNQYLKEEGLETIAALRARRGETGAVRELFSRCAKSLVLSGPVQPAEGDRCARLHARTRGREEPLHDDSGPGAARSVDIRRPSTGGRPRRRHQP